MQTFLIYLYILKEVSSIILFLAVAGSIVYAYYRDHKIMEEIKKWIQIKVTGKLANTLNKQIRTV